MVQDLYILMITAGVVSLLFKLMKQPVVLGYIVAGVLVGPYLFGKTLVSAENVEAWGNIGVLFVLFCIGLEFRIKNLISSGKVAAIGALTIIGGHDAPRLRCRPVGETGYDELPFLGRHAVHVQHDHRHEGC